MYRYLSILLLLAMACQQQPMPVQMGISEDLANWRHEHIDELFYQLSFQIPASREEKIRGNVEATFQLDDVGQDLQFDFKGDGAIVHSVVANGEKIPVRWELQHVIVDSSYLKKGENKIVIQFTSPNQSLNRNDDYLYTLFVPDRASTAFPCFDQPNLKGKFSLELTVPNDWKAVGNGPEEKAEPEGEFTKHVFAQTQPLPTYLFAFVAGKFEAVSREHNGRAYTLYHRENSPAKLENNLDDIFNLLFLSVDSIESYTGIPYPFAKYDLVAIPSFQYGGMEHPGVTLYSDLRMFLEGKPTPRELLNRANLIAHETSHMWFGDLVTMPWFDEVWLKEVYANFIADKVTSPLFPDFNQDLLFLMAHYADAYSVDRTGGTNPITQPLSNLKDAGTLYGSIIYHKAPVVMRMLEDRIGKDALQKGLQTYLKDYSYGNAGWNELISILDTDGSLSQWSKVWVEEAGRPTLTATVEGDDLLVQLQDPAGKNRIWQQELEIVWSVNDSLHQAKIELDSADIRFTNLFTGGKPEWLYLNGNGKAYGFIRIDPQTQDFFSQHLSEVPDVLVRAGGWIDLRENMLEGNMEPVAFAEAIINNLPNESDAVLYERMLSYLSACYQYNLNEAQQEALQSKIEGLISTQLKIHADHANALCNAAISVFRSEKGMATLYDGWKKQYLQANALTATQLTNLSLVLAAHIPQQADAILDEQEARLDNPDLKARFQFIRPAVSADEAVRDSVFNSFAKAENREHEPWVQTSLGLLNSVEFAEGREKYIRPALELLPEIQQTGDIFFPYNWVNQLLGGHRSAEAAEAVRDFLRANPQFPAPLKLKVLQAADHLLRAYPDQKNPV
ncbi:M1 family metallopeptidase [Mangrovibacterium diazotrophicum]|uniref:Aminopeptidase N n=1 Tax=Mangrovibacterium diazotrophicum TaxID=1261403 RepID=A0A419W8F8_9BACT|nr:M1 family aminopeptidase [Mangrovibacterium diazotrophicum]RKD91736.1 aminopeptidase N [Mangrovibacterium diazotrophicum]